MCVLLSFINCNLYTIGFFGSRRSNYLCNLGCFCLTKSPENRNQTIKTRQKIKESNTTLIPLIPSHSKMKSKQSKSRDNPGKYYTLPGAQNPRVLPSHNPTNTCHRIRCCDVRTLRGPLWESSETGRASHIHTYKLDLNLKCAPGGAEAKSGLVRRGASSLPQCAATRNHINSREPLRLDADCRIVHRPAAHDRK